MATSQLSGYDDGGPNDPRTTFNALREWLTAVKEELSPWGWQAYASEFREKMKAEKKLQALNNLAGSGAEPKDGIVAGTPLWQERLDQMLLVEHLKKKVMSAHTALVEATNCLLDSHMWLMKDALLADAFAACVSRVPPSQHDRLDLLHYALKQAMEDVKAAKEEFQDYKTWLKIKRQEYITRTVEHQRFAIARKRQDDVLVSWRYAAQRSRSLDLEGANYALVNRINFLEAHATAGKEDFEEASRQWDEQRLALEKDRDEYKRLYEKFLKAHEQAMADLEQSQGTAEDQAKMLQVLTVEKHRLTGEVEELQNDKKRMAKQLSDLRDEMSKLKAELRRLGQQLRESEEAVLASRTEVGKLRADALGMEDLMLNDGDGPAYPSKRRLLRDAAHKQAQLLDRLKAAEASGNAARKRLEAMEGRAGRKSGAKGGIGKSAEIGVLTFERQVRAHLEVERDTLLKFARDTDLECKKVKSDCFKTIEDTKNKFAKELNNFKEVEIGKIRAEFELTIAHLSRKNAQLEREVAVADAVGPHLPTLNPLGSGQDQRLCSSCKRAIVFEGEMPNP